MRGVAQLRFVALPVDAVDVDWIWGRTSRPLCLPETLPAAHCLYAPFICKLSSPIEPLAMQASRDCRVNVEKERVRTVSRRSPTHEYDRHRGIHRLELLGQVQAIHFGLVDATDRKVWLGSI
ncbi:hypothetical protein [Acidisoma sp.]|uniref:hypothetical protein n=1 Tax=Acidisoma sp. TaxID=1872115 RepID=UPI003AFF947B